MKLREWAKKQGICYRTAVRWFHAGTLPVEAEQMAIGSIIVNLEPVLGDQKAALCARVSSSDQKTNLDSQLVRLTHFVVENKLSIAAVRRLRPGAGSKPGALHNAERESAALLKTCFNPGLWFRFNPRAETFFCDLRIFPSTIL